MSYILDALRKADAQRQRERPGLHAHPVAADPSSDAGHWSKSPLVWGVAGVVVAGLAALAWWPAQSPTQVAVAPTAPDVAPAPVTPPPAAAITPAAPPAAATAIEPPPPPARAVQPPAPAPAPAPARRQAAEPAPPKAVAQAPASAPLAAKLASAPVAAMPASAASTAEGPPPADAPKLSVTGGVYSADPAQRMLIVGGQVFNEGSQVAPGVVLEQVRPHQAVLSFRGQRYTVAY
ncbi:general secretion pathway protein GspB [Ramlibacter algicola]|uniref:General secretion pathway protein GspB n=1 Tax=Ramlibacter algicola TaxID=2795217 RepID=A0A934URE0_9BURK|nr:general secretion pathway protein GspB [Ramlibacter algicola]MBK0393085.1 general secretion pathway protein GspB [Ramlibacter algicola]